MSRKFIQSILSKFGYYLRSTNHFGDSLWQDIENMIPKKPGQDLIFVDVGAHHGETIAPMRSLFSRATIHAFEPDPDSFKILTSSVIKDQNLYIHQIALGDKPGTAKFRRNLESMTNSLLPTSQESLSGSDAGLTTTTEEIEVAVDTLHNFCAQNKLDRIDLLKTDCQGFDLKVLCGASELLSKQRIGLVTCEMIFDDEYEGQGHAHQIMATMQEFGYSLIGFYNMARNERSECTFCDALFAPHKQP